jgi:hypothetical protein
MFRKGKSPAKTPHYDVVAKPFRRKLDFTILKRSSTRLQVSLYEPIRRIFLRPGAPMAARALRDRRLGDARRRVNGRPLLRFGRGAPYGVNSLSEFRPHLCHCMAAPVWPFLP